MTVAVAVQKGGRTVVAADSLVHFGGQRCPPDNCRFRKIHEFGSSLVVCAGWTLYTELLTAYCAQHGMPEIEGEAGVFDFFLQFWRSRDRRPTSRSSAARRATATIRSRTSTPCS